jgi:hypothetical protein
VRRGRVKQLSIINYQLSITSYQLLIINYQLFPTPYTPHPAPQTLPIAQKTESKKFFAKGVDKSKNICNDSKGLSKGL